jgi:hypothetical protein
MLTLLLAPIAGFLFFEFWRGLRHGRIGWGQAARLRSEEPLPFWGQMAYAFVSALALTVSLVWHWQYGELPEVPLVQICIASWFSVLIIRALARGRVSVGSVSFARAEEPREFWLLAIGGLLFVTLLWSPLLLAMLSR